ncbi:MAG TPA: hypothetical protein DCS93_30490 [Microscillaceae bacterium]|nr:hypothetical protein [Microscillaceae bacterium]
MQMKITLKPIWSLLLLVGMAYQASAQTNQKLSLKASLQKALENSREVRAQKLGRKATNHQVKEVISQGLPQISAFGSFDNNMILPTQFLPGELAGQPGGLVPVQFGTRYNTTVGVELQQLIFSQSFVAGVKAAKKARALTELQIRQSEEDVLYKVASLYYGIQVLLKQKQILLDNLSQINTLINTTELQYKNGIAKKVDITRLKVNQVNLSTDLDQVETTYAQQINMLKYYLGTPQNETIAIDENTSASILSDYTASFDKRTEIQLLYKQQELNQEDIKQVKAGYLPTLTGFLRYSQMNQTNEFAFSGANANWNETAVLGLRLNIPLFDGFTKSHRLQQKKITMAQTNLRINDTKAMMATQYQNSLVKLQKQQDILGKQKLNVTLAKEVYSSIENQYKQGITTLTDLLNTENSLKTAQNSYLKALVELKVAELEFVKANGKIRDIL